MKPQLIIGISGGSGSGKTFFANQLTQHFSKHQIGLVHFNHRQTATADRNTVAYPHIIVGLANIDFQSKTGLRRIY